MRILVTSDSHGDYRRLRTAVDKAAPFDIFVFLGDGENDFDIVTRNMVGISTYKVRGNNDYHSNAPITYIVKTDSHNILITHGASLNLWNDYSSLIEIANEKNCQAALFGHTHVRHYSFERGVHLFNPGSISTPRDGKNRSYGIVTDENGKLDFYHFDV